MHTAYAIVRDRACYFPAHAQRTERPPTYAGEVELVENEVPPRQLRALIPVPTPASSAVVPVQSKEERRVERQLAEMHSTALAMNHVCTPLSQVTSTVGTSITSRMTTRGSKFIYQLATDSICLIPKAAVEQWMPTELLVERKKTRLTWKSGTSSMTNVRQMAAALISQGGPFCAGLTRSLISDSERVIRVVATAMPEMEVVWTQRMGVDVMRYELRYVLADESGGLRFPKDHQKIEIAVTPELESDLREEILFDLDALYQQGAPLAPGFLRQLGKELEADVLEAKLQNAQEQEEAQETLEDSSAPKKKRRRRPTGETFLVDCIVEERTEPQKGYRVRWLGYHHTWETAYERAGGQHGDPFETWEPYDIVKDTEALLLWEAQ